MTIFAVVANTLSPDIVARIARSVDEPVDKTQRAINALVHTLVGGLLKRTTSDIGVGQLFGQLTKGQFDGQVAASLPTILNDPARTNVLIGRGDEAVSRLLPAMKSSIGSMISSYAGIRNSSAIALLGLVSAVMLDELGRQATEKKLDAVGLANFLHEQREDFLAAVPDDLLPRLIDKLGLQQLVAPPANPNSRRPAGSAVASARPADTAATSTPERAPVTYMSEPEPETGSPLLRWGGGALLILLLGIGFFVWQKNRQTPTYTTEATGATESDSIGMDTVARSLDVPVDTAIGGATLPPSATSAVPTPATTVAPTAGLTGAIGAYLADPIQPKGRVFPLTGVAFVPGSTTLTPGSDAVITELVSLLRTHPTTQIRLTGYANDAQAGLANKALSFKRVNVIKQQLVNAGINFIRVDAIGLGTGVPKPKPGDSTAVRRPTLRKIDLKVVVK